MDDRPSQRGRRESRTHPDAMEFAQIMVDSLVPPYRALMESYDKAQSVQKTGRETKLERLETAEAKK
jgi:CRISPR/Cas system endoribonuclease Cas6 (RAMP superfamily)